MKILILGGAGMLGHQLLRMWGGRHEVRVTLRGPLADYQRFGLFDPGTAYDRIEATDLGAVDTVLGTFRPEVLVNCVGIVKQRSEAKAAIPSIEINALLPHRLRELCEAHAARLIHISTDCVFSGRTGGYVEGDIPDPVDLYGRSKLLGEVDHAPALTVRTSIVGLELSRFTGLVEWFLAERGIIHGFTGAIYSGLSTRELARAIEHVLVHTPDLSGIWQVASAPITKYDLLVELARRLGRTDVAIEADAGFVCDRSLNGRAFEARTGYRVASWDVMLDELANDIRARGPRPA
jgi:dTDP-4-dehydrorhamnose reductase